MRTELYVLIECHDGGEEENVAVFDSLVMAEQFLRWIHLDTGIRETEYRIDQIPYNPWRRLDADEARGTSEDEE